MDRQAQDRLDEHVSRRRPMIASVVAVCNVRGSNARDVNIWQIDPTFACAGRSPSDTIDQGKR
jgi:hypothetical protein